MHGFEPEGAQEAESPDSEGDGEAGEGEGAALSVVPRSADRAEALRLLHSFPPRVSISEGASIHPFVTHFSMRVDAHAVAPATCLGAPCNGCQERARGSS
jgi:hypothetical protein